MMKSFNKIIFLIFFFNCLVKIKFKHLKVFKYLKLKVEIKEVVVIKLFDIFIKYPVDILKSE